MSLCGKKNMKKYECPRLTDRGSVWTRWHESNKQYLLVVEVQLGKWNGKDIYSMRKATNRNITPKEYSF